MDSKTRIRHDSTLVPGICGTAHPGNNELVTRTSVNCNVTNHVWLFYDCIQLLQHSDSYCTERKIMNRHLYVVEGDDGKSMSVPPVFCGTPASRRPGASK